MSGDAAAQLRVDCIFGLVEPANDEQAGAGNFF
jgi:hypothetical protein